jgi:hypothetical protein
MTSGDNNNSGCLFPFGDDFLPILMFFFHVNQANSSNPQFDEDDEGEEEDSDSDDNDDNEW